jgi:hypothetical protein
MPSRTKYDSGASNLRNFRLGSRAGIGAGAEADLAQPAEERTSPTAAWGWIADN